MTLEDILLQLQNNDSPKIVAAQQHFGISGENRLGITAPQLRAFAPDSYRDLREINLSYL